jgi:acetyl esterase/lipase
MFFFIVKNLIFIFLFFLIVIFSSMSPKSQVDSNGCNSLIYVHDKPASSTAKFVISGADLFKFNNYKTLIETDTFKTAFAYPSRKIQKKYEVLFETVDARKVCYLLPKPQRKPLTILYIHGGGYAGNLNKLYYENIFGPIIDQTGAAFVIPDYGLAPYYTYKNAYEFIGEVYSKLLIKVGAENIILMGESAGGGFSLGFTQWLNANKLNLPARLILLSPWLDVTMSNPGIKGIKDVILSVNPLKESGKLWAGDLSPEDYRISPINGNIDGLPPVSVFIGGQDLLHPDVMKLKKKMDDACIPIEIYEYPEMFHVWMMFGFLPESKESIRQICQIINKME